MGICHKQLQSRSKELPLLNLIIGGKITKLIWRNSEILQKHSVYEPYKLVKTHKSDHNQIYQLMIENIINVRVICWCSKMLSVQRHTHH